MAQPLGSDWGQPAKLGLRPLPGPALPRPGQLLLDAQWGHARRLTGALPVTETGSVGSRLRVLEGGGQRSRTLCRGEAGGKRGLQPQRARGQAALHGQRAHPARCHLCKCHGPEAALCVVYGHTPVWRKHEAACGMRSSNPRGAVGTVRRWGQRVCRGAAGTVPGALLLSKERDRLGHVTEC